MKGLRTNALTHMAEWGQDDTAIYDLQTDLHYSSQTASDILQSFLKNGLIEVSVPDKGDSRRGRVPYVLTPRGRKCVRLMEHLRNEQMVSEEKDLELDLELDGPLPFSQDKDRTLKLEQAGFTVEDWETAVRSGLITEKRKVVTMDVVGLPVDPSKGMGRMMALRYTYSIN